MVGTLTLLSDLRSAYLASYDVIDRAGGRSANPVCSATLQTGKTAVKEDARKRLVEQLGLLCTAICIAGEEYVRSFPTNLYVLLLTDILTAANMARRSDACATNPFLWGGYESNPSFSLNATDQQAHKVAPKSRLNGLPVLHIPCMGIQAASPVDVLAIRALALIADIVPNGSYALCPNRSTDTITTLALYLGDPELLVVNEDLAEELLKCFLYVSVVAHDACVDARVPLRAVELLLVLEPHHLRVLCVQVLSNLLSRARESDLEEVWSSVMTKFLESFESFLFESSLCLNAPGTAHRVATNGSSTLTSSPAVPATQSASAAGARTAYSPPTFGRSLTSREATLLQHYMEAIAHAVDRLFVRVASMKAHMKLLHHAIQVCVQLLHLSLSITPATCGEWLRSVALSPIVAFYLANPTFAVPMLLQLRVWEVVCGCMLTLVQRSEAAPRSSSATVDGGARRSEIAGSARADAAAMHGGSSADTTFSSASPSASSSLSIQSDSIGNGGNNAAAATSRSSAIPLSGLALSTGPVLTTDVTTIPFIADELRLLPLLEFLLVLLPCARRGHSHTDFRNTTLPYFGWSWEDDFHNEMACNEALSRRLERVYQQTRNCRKHELFALTQGRQRVFYTDFLSKSFLSERRERHCLHRKPLLSGYVHGMQNALRDGCTCRATEPTPLFSTWVNHNYVRIRTADTESGNQHGESDSDAVGDAEDEDDGSLVVGPVLRDTAMTGLSSPTSSRGNDARGSGRGAASPSLSHLERHRMNLRRTTGVHASGSMEEGADRDAATNQSARVPSGGAGMSREGRGGAAIVHAGNHFPRSTHSREVEGDADEGHHGSATNRGQNEAVPRRARRHSGRLGFLLCKCGSDTKATVQSRRRQTQIRAHVPDSPSFPFRYSRSLAITILPMEAMLEGPGERLQADPATRKAFLGKGVLSSILSTMVPALLSVLDNCVNPVVARHSVTLLLRCLSLSADLRTQVTGEAIECFTNGGSGEEAAVATAALESSEKKGRLHMSFRKFITGGVRRNPRRWQRAEWEATQVALLRLLPSLREVLVSLYVADEVSIVAERQEIFGPARDDLLMVDELARVGLSSEFFGFQLALPCEQHVCTADAIVLLLGLLSNPKQTASLASTSSLTTLWKSKKVSSLHISPRPNITGGADDVTQLSMAQSTSSLGVSRQGSVMEHPSPVATQAALYSQHRPAQRLTATSLTPLGTLALPRGGSVSQGGHVHAMHPSPPTSRPARAQQQGSADGKMNTSMFIGAGIQSPPHLSPTAVSRPSSLSFSQTINTNCSSSRETVHDLFSKTSYAATAGGRGTSGTGVFTLHQSTLLVSYARQIMRRSRKVCAAAQRIHESMNEKMYCTRAVVGSSEVGNDGMPQLRSRELTLRLFPDASCPYHSTFPACTDTFFHASQALLAALLAAGASLPAPSLPPAAASRHPLTGPTTTSFSPVIAAAPSPVGRRMPATSLTVTTSERAGIAPPTHTRAPSQVKREEAAPMNVGLSLIPATVDATAMQEAIDRAMQDNDGVYRRLPPALRGVLGFYDHCKQLNIELRAAVVETPEILGEIAANMETWLLSRVRQREETECSTSGLALSTYMSNTSFDSSGSRGADAGPSNQQHLCLDSTARGKLLCLTADFATAIGRDLGLATLDLVPSGVMKQPCTFPKRAKRSKTLDTIRYLAWRPLSIALELKTSRLAEQEQNSSRATPDATCAGWRNATPAETPVVMVGHAELPIVTGVTLRKHMLSVLPTTTIGLLAEVVAAQIELPPAAASPSNSVLKPSQPSPPAEALHATQECHRSSDSGSSTVGGRSLYLTNQNSFEKRHSSTLATATTVSATGWPLSADRILFFLNNTPLFSPMTTLLDALTAFSVSGASLRDLVATQRSSSETVDEHSAKITVTLPTLPFWTLTHVLEFVVLAEPLQASLILDLTARTSASSAGGCCCCGCDGLRPSFLCSPKHLFDEAPLSGPLALYSALSTLMREEVGSSPALLESNQRRLCSAVVHELYHQLNMFILPPLLWCSGIGLAARGGPGSDVASTAATLSSEAFPLPSYVLWCYPFIFSAEMRLSIFKFFVSAQRSLSRDEADRLLQSYRHLLVRRAPADEARAATSGAAADDEKTLDIVGLEWLSEEVARRHRITLTVQRHNVLRCAEELIRLATCNVTVDVAFEGEAGIGNGPAMEFYEMVAEELVDPKHGLWRTELFPTDEAAHSPSLLPFSTNLSLHTAAGGGPPRRRPCMPLFPAAKQTPASLHYWKLLGVLLGRLLVIGATTSLSFHPLLLRRLRGESLISTAMEASRNMSQLDAALELTLHRLETMSADSLAACELFFTIPASETDGYVPGAVEEQPLMPGGAHRQVTSNNVHEYTHCLRSYYLQTVLDLALLHLRQGLQLTVNPLYLQLFNVDELGRLLGSPQGAKIWETREQFARSIEPAHGYTIRSDVVQYLLDVVPTWNARIQHAFLKFVTGSSAVPYGGLTQRIKVVRRDVDISAVNLAVSPTAYSFGANSDGLVTTSSVGAVGTNYDNSLPTVSTCFLYLKLPQYSSKVVLQDRLLFAVREGQCFFSLT